ncbi:DUF732 domain-containing protein [Mycobacterium sp.]|jgi:Protein of unknown function (DUF732)|uniref:DUF732 domain-containing protein n=1 Tax=Mycobacterium sp. TaxID=1785 RepID=UPI003C770068
MTCALSAVVSHSTMAVNPFRAVLAAAAAVMLAAGIAQADGPDDQFLAMLSKDGVVGPPDQMIAIAHERCDDANLPRSGGFNFRFGAGPSPYMFAIGNIYNELESQGMTSAQAAQFIRDAIAVYCPDQKGR